MTDNRIRLHSAETRNEAIRLYGQGLMPRQIAARLCVPYEAVRYWCEKHNELPVQRVRTKAKSGSGVIAPPAYRYGYRWGGSVL